MHSSEETMYYIFPLRKLCRNLDTPSMSCRSYFLSHSVSNYAEAVVSRPFIWPKSPSESRPDYSRHAYAVRTSNFLTAIALIHTSESSEYETVRVLILECRPTYAPSQSFLYTTADDESWYRHPSGMGESNVSFQCSLS